jgi:hypothetical protein
MDFAGGFVTRAIGSMADDFCLPIPDEPAVELQLVEPVRCGLFGMQKETS